MVVIGITPIPIMAIILGRAIAQGRAAGLAAMAGASARDPRAQRAGRGRALGAIVAAPTRFRALKLAGAADLAWLAVQAIRHELGGPAARHVRRRGSGLGRHLDGGRGDQAAELPKLVLFVVTHGRLAS